MMKARLQLYLSVALALCVLLPCFPGFAMDTYAPPISGLATQRVSSRSGPGTEFTETGSYSVKGDYLTIVSYCYDKGNTLWLQVEVPYRGKLRRVYTGAKRFDMDGISLEDLTEDADSGYRARVVKSSQALYGPGDGYDAYSDVTIAKGTTVTCLAYESGYMQVQFESDASSSKKQVQCRCWVSETKLDLSEYGADYASEPDSGTYDEWQENEQQPSESAGTTCPVCGGRGRCKYCAGGMMYAGGDRMETCHFCWGSMLCYMCGGSGTID